MFVRIWCYRVRESDRHAFELRYRGDGDWARLFARAPGYLGTETLRGTAETQDDDAAVYVTIDRWGDKSDWLRFREAHDDEYRALDRICEELTASETDVGEFSLLGAKPRPG